MDELIHVSIAGAVHLVGLAAPDDLAAVDHGDVVGDFAGRRHVMGDGDGGGAEALHAIDDQVVDDVGHDGIKARGGLIEENDFGIGGDGAGQRHALLHSARKLRGIKAAHIRCQTHLGQLVGGHVLSLRSRHAAALNQAEGHVFPHAQTVEEGRTLEQHAEAREIFIARRTFQPDDILAADQDLSAIGSEDADDAFQHHGFSGAGTADHHKGAALAHFKVDAVQYMLGAEMLVHRFEHDVGGLHAHSPNSSDVSRKFAARMRMADDTTALVVARPTPCAPPLELKP